MPASKVIVVGELNVDLIFSGEDIALEPNREKLAGDFRLALGSSSAITAAGLAGLGMAVEFVSIVGDDDFGRYCVRELERLGVGTSGVRVEPRSRTGATLSLTDGKDRSLLTFVGTIDALTPEAIPDGIWEGAAHLHFGSYFLQKRMQPHWASVFRQAKKRGLTTSFDAGWDPDETWDRERLKSLLAWTDWFIPSEEEALRIFGIRELSELEQALPEARGFLVVKRGAAGALAIGPDGSVAEGQPFAVSPVDTTGAGDSFNAGWIAAMLRGESREGALRFANACGALSTLAIGGAGTLTREGLERFLAE